MLKGAVVEIVRAQQQTERPLAIVIAGHNGSGKSTMWHDHLADTFRIPLINADRMMLSVLPEAVPDPALPGRRRLIDWAAELRDTDRNWMVVAQQGVEEFVRRAMNAKVPFAMETVFSHRRQREDGSIESKIDRILDMQRDGYFVLLFFVGLASVELSVLRVQTRVKEGGHGIPEPRLRERFPRTQMMISQAVKVADASILVDNSRSASEAFTVCRIQHGTTPIYDIRDEAPPPAAILEWMDVVVPC